MKIFPLILLLGLLAGSCRKDNRDTDISPSADISASTAQENTDTANRSISIVGSYKSAMEDYFRGEMNRKTVLLDEAETMDFNFVRADRYNFSFDFYISAQTETERI